VDGVDGVDDDGAGTLGATLTIDGASGRQLAMIAVGPGTPSGNAERHGAFTLGIDTPGMSCTNCPFGAEVQNVAVADGQPEADRSCTSEPPPNTMSPIPLVGTRPLMIFPAFEGDAGGATGPAAGAGPVAGFRYCSEAQPVACEFVIVTQ